MQDQLSIVEEKNSEKIGRTFRTIVEEYDNYTDSFVGRTYMDAPEIDGLIRFTSEEYLEAGDIVDVKVFDIDEYDLIGEAVK